MGKYLPGNPNTIVQNMPGAGQLIAANHLYNRAQPDGLTIGHFSGSVIFRHVLGDQGVMLRQAQQNGIQLVSVRPGLCINVGQFNRDESM